MLTKQKRQAKKILRAMAFNRQTFTDKLQFILSGALTHYYMVQLAQLNGQTKWVQHWKTEVDRLINFDTVQVLIANIKGLEGVHHVHVWSITQRRRMVTLHACIGDASQSDQAVKDIKARLKSAFGLDHATVEIEHGECADTPKEKLKA